MARTGARWGTPLITALLVGATALPAGAADEHEQSELEMLRDRV